MGGTLVHDIINIYKSKWHPLLYAPPVLHYYHMYKSYTYIIPCTLCRTTTCQCMSYKSKSYTRTLVRRFSKGVQKIMFRERHCNYYMHSCNYKSYPVSLTTGVE
jgi:hypothetical protein